MRNVFVRSQVAAVLLVAAAGCDGGAGSSIDARDGIGATTPDGGRTEAVPMPAPSPADAADWAGEDGPTGSVDVRPPPPDFPPPPVASPLPDGPKPQRLLGSNDRLAGYGPGACSEPDPSAVGAHRWCAFYRTLTAADATRSTELWVINLTKAAAGNVPACDGSSADCIRLTTTLWTSLPLFGPGHPYDHRFSGETLIFYAGSTSVGQEIHKGPVSAWRPGWTQARPLTSSSGVMCFAHASKPLVHCMDGFAGEPMRLDSFEIFAGAVAQSPSAPLLSLGRIRPFLTDGTPAWQARFSPDGETFAISSPDPDPAVETLRVVSTKDLGKVPPREILRGATDWFIAHDSRRIYFTRRDTAESTGLYAADFPSGAAEVKLAADLREYIVPGEGAVDQGIAFRTRVTDELTAFRYLRDSRSPATAVTVFSHEDILEDMHMSPDLRYTGWLDANFNARVVRHADLSSCDLNINPGGSAFEPLFLGSGGLVFWNEDEPGGTRRDGFFARPDDCRVQARFATGVFLYTPLADRGLVYTDERDPYSRGSLKYAAARKTGADWELVTPVRVKDHVDEGDFTLIGSPPSLVIFRTSGPDEANPGVWVFGPVPL